MTGLPVTNPRRNVANTAELQTTLSDGVAATVVVSGRLTGVPTLRLRPGQSVVGADKAAALSFELGADGLVLTCDNTVEGLALHADPGRRAVCNDTTQDRLGRLVLRDLAVTGRVEILATGSVRGGHVEVRDLHVEAADARAEEIRPRGFGVEVVPGAFTLWNRQADPGVTVTADLVGLSAGRAGAPVRGSGVFVAGTPGGGRVLVSRLHTGPVWSDGGIPPGTADRIAGGVFTVSGARVASVHNAGPVTTYGANDMVLDNWGEVDRWVADGPVTSFGPSAIGFVNFGPINVLRVNAPIETFGVGARGFNVYAGTVADAEFDRVVTHGDGAVGIQLSQPVGRIAVRRGVETFGGVGDSLVKGAVMRLPALALSLKPGATARQVSVAGGLRTHGPGVNAIELHGRVDSLVVEDGFGPAGGGFEAI